MRRRITNKMRIIIKWMKKKGISKEIRYDVCSESFEIIFPSKIACNIMNQICNALRGIPHMIIYNDMMDNFRINIFLSSRKTKIKKINDLLSALEIAEKTIIQNENNEGSKKKN
jgi:hypothetical protein